MRKTLTVVGFGIKEFGREDYVQRIDSGDQLDWSMLTVRPGRRSFEGYALLSDDSATLALVVSINRNADFIVKAGPADCNGAYEYGERCVVVTKILDWWKKQTVELTDIQPFGWYITGCPTMATLYPAPLG